MEALYIIVMFLFFIVPTIIAKAWWWVAMTVSMFIVFVVFEAVAYFKDGSTLSQKFGKMEKKHRISMIAGFAIFWIMLLVHLWMM